MKNSLLIFLLLFLFQSTAFGEASKRIEADEKQLFHETLKPLHLKNDYDGLESFRANLAKTGASFSDGTSKLREFYQYLSTCPVTLGDEKNYCLTFSSGWTTAKPEAVAPKTILAKVSLIKAWKVRGGGYATEKSEDTMEKFAALVNEAHTMLESAKALQGKDVEFYNTRYDIAALQGASEERLHSIFEEGLTLDKYYRPLYMMRANFLRPEWRGKRGALEAFADEAARKTKDKLGDSMYFLIADSVRENVGDAFFLRYRFDWKRLKVAFTDLEKRFPDDYYAKSHFLKLAIVADDRETAKKVTDRLGPGLDSRLPDMDASGYQALIDWANVRQNPVEKQLFAAVREGDSAALGKILKGGANINMLNSQGESPLVLATQHRPDLVPLLLEKGADPNTGSHLQLNAVDLAASNGDLPTMLLLIKAGGRPVDALEVAIHEDMPEVIRELIKHPDVNPNFLSELKPALEFAVQTNHIESAKVLLTAPKIAVNGYEPASIQPVLHFAVRAGAKDFVKLFLQAGADPNIVAPPYGTAFDVARETHPEMLELLKATHADKSDEANAALASAPPHKFIRGLPKDQQPTFNSALGGRMHYLLTNKKWKEVSKIHEKIASGGEWSESAKANLLDFYTFAAFCPRAQQVCRERFDAWEKADPQALPIIQTARARLAVGRWMRANSRAGARDSERDKELAAIVAEGKATVDKVLAAPGYDIETVVAAIELAFMGKESEAVVSALLDKGAALSPEYERLWVSGLQYVSTTKGLPALLPMVERAAAASKAKIGDGMYALLSDALLKFYGPEKYSTINLAWPRIRQGYQDLVNAYPNDKIYQVRLLQKAFDYRDRDTARFAIVKLGNQLDPKLFDHFQYGERGFNNIVLWSRGTEATKRNLVAAVKKGDKQGVDQALEDGERIDEVNQKRQNILHIALEHSPALIPYLISRGANPGVCSDEGKCVMDELVNRNLTAAVEAAVAAGRPLVVSSGSALSFAIKQKKTDIVRELLKRKDLEIARADAPGKKSDFEIAMETNQPEIVKLLAEHPNAQLNPTGTFGPPILSTPLASAIRLKKPEMVKLLLEKGANPSSKLQNIDNMRSALEIAQEQNNPAILAVLKSFSKPKLELKPLNPADENISQAVLKNDMTALDSLLTAKFPPRDPNHSRDPNAAPAVPLEQGYTAVHVAARNGNVPALKALYAREDYREAFLNPSENFERPLILAIQENKIDAVRFLLATCGVPQSWSTASEAPAALAARTGRKEILGLFEKAYQRAGFTMSPSGGLTKTRDLNAETVQAFLIKEQMAPYNFDVRDTAIARAIEKKAYDAIPALIADQRFDVNNLFGKGNQPLPLYTAVQLKDEKAIRMLLEAGANPRLKKGAPESALALAEKNQDQKLVTLLKTTRRLQPKATTNPQDEEIIESVLSGDVERIRNYLKEGSGPLSIQQGMTAAHIAAANNQLDSLAVLLSDERYKAILGTTAGNTPTPLHLATWKGNVEAVKMILSAGAFPQSKFRGEETPVEYVQRTENRELLPIFVDALEKRGYSITADGEVKPNPSKNPGSQ